MLRQHATHLEETGNVAAPAIGRHAKYNSIIKDEAVSQRMLKWVREDSETKKGVKREAFQRFVEKTFNVKIGRRTARTWLERELKLEYGAVRKGYYHDGHERSDVICDRNTFIPILMSYFPLMANFTLTGEQILPKLKGEEKQHIMVVQDESSFHVNDDHQIQILEREE